MQLCWVEESWWIGKLLVLPGPNPTLQPLDPRDHVGSTTPKWTVRGDLGRS